MDYHPREIKGIVGGTDETGVTSYQVPFYARNIEECATVARGYTIGGLPEKSRTWAPGEGAVFIVTVLYQGQANPSDSPKVSEVQTSLESSWTEEPIEYHPRLAEILKKYEGHIDKDNRVVFEPFLKDEKSQQGGLSKTESKSKKNPFFGIEKYQKLSVSYSRTYAAKSMPGNLLRRVGKIVNSPPGAPPELQGQTKWLVLPPSARQRGNVFEITENYQLMDADVPEELYDKAG